jgi:hypothetical protein
MLVRAVFINSQAYLSGDTNRECVHIDLHLGGNSLGPLNMSVKRLSIGWVALNILAIVLYS